MCSKISRPSEILITSKSGFVVVSVRWVVERNNAGWKNVKALSKTLTELSMMLMLDSSFAMPGLCLSALHGYTVLSNLPEVKISFMNLVISTRTIFKYFLSLHRHNLGN